MPRKRKHVYNEKGFSGIERERKKRSLGKGVGFEGNGTVRLKRGTGDGMWEWTVKLVCRMCGKGLNDPFHDSLEFHISVDGRSLTRRNEPVSGKFQRNN